MGRVRSRRRDRHTSLMRPARISNKSSAIGMAVVIIATPSVAPMRVRSGRTCNGVIHMAMAMQ